MSLYDEIGGADAVHATVELFYDKVLTDPALAGFFTQTDMARQRAHQRMFIAAALGGPDPFTGRGMAQAHAPLGLTDAHFDAVVGHLVATLTELGVAQGHIATIGDVLAPLRSEIVTAA